MHSITKIVEIFFFFAHSFMFDFGNGYKPNQIETQSHVYFSFRRMKKTTEEIEATLE